MFEREVRVSPDGQTVGIRTDWPADSEMAWGCIHAKHGGHWSLAAHVADWNVVTAMVAPEPPAQEPLYNPELEV